MENLTLHQESLRALFRTLLQLMNFYVYSRQQIVPLFLLTDSHDEQEHMCTRRKSLVILKGNMWMESQAEVVGITIA